MGAARIEEVLGHRLVRMLSNTLVAALLGLAMFTLFLTPFFYVLRTNPAAEVVLTLLVPVMGLLMTVPIMEDGAGRTASLIVVEFIFVFIELLADAVPGVLMRLSPGVLDGARRSLGNHAALVPLTAAGPAARRGPDVVSRRGGGPSPHHFDVRPVLAHREAGSEVFR